MPRFGSQSMTGRLERVLVRPPLAEDAERWREYGWRAAPDHAAAAAEHEALCGILEAAGAEVVVSPARPRQSGRDLRLRPGARRRARAPCSCGPGRRSGAASRSRSPSSLAAADVPMLPSSPSRSSPRAATPSGSTSARSSSGSATGRTRPRSRAGDAFPGVEVVAFDLPHWNGAARSCTSCRSSRRSTAISRSSTRGSRRCGCSSSSPSAASRSSRFRTRSSRRRARTSSRSARAGARARRQPGDAPPHGARRGRRRRLPRRGDLEEGRRRPDLPHAGCCAS